jgi:hypothetical protein
MPPSAVRHRLRTWVLALSLATGAASVVPTAAAMPEFARRYNMSCAACHSAFPRLNKLRRGVRRQQHAPAELEGHGTVKTGDR